ncbi:MAG: sensory transduction histidine kinase [Candidatus Methanoperedens nitroreducens]|uniref:Sensory transduction histidine kinase n=1 Tax=Candidatus Methanoperedens nitratireducens TaxID=1392998 RepID=A0A0P8A7Y7_9EURY|nr:PAS domain S-box protein [Candidatus Methanoperedens sp. BLZ2]KAB2946954.1 MAG: PAS domain S-box protein [Candidatus Methanoperedens sp.]KPQ44284.1 MAG: sensory transduction histidine kinase [Candidatus Methanoperedens sp. BLZ1]MBZ0176753.1 PAS domain S-box protein [Candidatus Methanoperedens nitroreducens]MCX9080474.1 PAS domain S-box protein [Candidatus Methanoperedens sp.]
MGDESKTIEQLISELNELAESFKTKPMFEGLFQFAPDAIVVVNRGGDIVQINKQAEKMFGYSTDEVFGKPVEILCTRTLQKAACGAAQ